MEHQTETPEALSASQTAQQTPLVPLPQNRLRVVQVAGLALLSGVLGVVLGLQLAGTPEECTEALGHAEKSMSIQAEALGVGADAIRQAAAWNSAGLNASTSRVDSLALDLEASAGLYREKAAMCRGE